MPADLRTHVRYPETLIRAQGEVYSLYHTQNPKVFFQREDVWSVAQHITVDEQGKKQSAPIDPYFVLMQLPGEQQKNEFVLILPFTPANRNNMIGWMAGRSDGENYGKLLVYNFPKSTDRWTSSDRSTHRSERATLGPVHALEPAGLSRDTRASAGDTDRTFADVRRADLLAGGTESDAGAATGRAGDAGETGIRTNVC